jgi:large subunit ribosomal protein L5
MPKSTKSTISIKKGDQVRVIAGKDKGAEGKVIRVLREEDRVIVEGVNRIKKHTKVINQGGRVQARRGHQEPSRRFDLQSKPERPHLAEDRRRDLMTETKTENVAGEMPRMKARYREEILPALREEFGFANVMQVPGLTKIVVNMGVGEAARDSKLIEGAVKDLTAITGQKPQVTKARKSIAQFKLREGMPIGAHVTLRGDRMWEFLDRLLALALPRIRDFRGLSGKQFDGRGNYTFGLTEQVMFHEIDQDRIDRSRGMDITIVTTATNDDEGRALLKHLGFPFKEN